MNIFKRKAGKGPDVSNRRREKGQGIGGRFATETRKTNDSVVLQAAPTEPLTDRTRPFTDEDRTRVDLAREQIAEQIKATRQKGIDLNDGDYTYAATQTEAVVMEALESAQTVGEACDAIRKGSSELYRTAMGRFHQRDSMRSFRNASQDLHDTLSNAEESVGMTAERRTIRAAADMEAAANDPVSDRGFTLSSELKQADSAEAACAAIDRRLYTMSTQNPQLLAEHEAGMQELRAVIEDAAGRSIAPLTPEEHEAETYRRAVHARRERSLPRAIPGPDGYFRAVPST